jgi:Uma2 family endonuclease
MTMTQTIPNLATFEQFIEWYPSNGVQRDYEEMGIPEYWIVDYAAIGGKRFTGNPQQQTLTICELVDGDYQMTVFRVNNFIVSPLFPQLNFTAQQIFDSAL